MEVRYCDVEMVQIGNRLRHLDPDKVAALAESMNAIGLQQPISVWSDSIDTLELVAGLHRLEAARKLGWENIDCIFVDMDEIGRQLWEIDENLMRAELTAMERAQHTAKRAEVVKQKKELSAKSANNSEGAEKRGPKNKGQVDFVADTAKKTGRSKRSVEADKARGEKIAADVQKEIAGTDIEDSGVQLDALADATQEEQREAVQAVVLGHAKDVRQVLPGKGKRRTPEEINADEFDYTFRSLLRTCSMVPVIDVPALASEQRSQYLARLQPAIKQLQDFGATIQGSHEENEPARRKASRPARWSDAASRAVTALEEIQEMQSEYQEWLDTLPDNLQESAVAEKLTSITEIDFDSAIETVREAEDADLPLGFGRD